MLALFILLLPDGLGFLELLHSVLKYLVALRLLIYPLGETFALLTLEHASAMRKAVLAVVAHARLFVCLVRHITSL